MDSTDLSKTLECYEPALHIESIKGKSCLCHKEFCFFCEFAIQREDDSDPRYELSQLVTLLSEQGKNIRNIIEAVYTAYEKNIKQDITWFNPETQTDVSAPSWSRDSIRRHLLHTAGSEFKQIFDVTVDEIVQNITYRLNDSMIDSETQLVDQTTLNSFIKLLDHYHKWKNIPSKRKALCGKKKSPTSVTKHVT